MERSRCELSKDVVIHRYILNINQITLFPCFNFMPKQGLVFTVFKHFWIFHLCESTVVQPSHIMRRMNTNSLSLL